MRWGRVFLSIGALVLFLSLAISLSVGAYLFGIHDYDIQTAILTALGVFFGVASISVVFLFSFGLVMLPLWALGWLVREIREDERKAEEKHEQMLRRIKEEMANTPPGECHHRKLDGSLDLQCHWFGPPTCRQCGEKWDSSGYCFCPKPSFPFSLCGMCKWCGSHKLDYDDSGYHPHLD